MLKVNRTRFSLRALLILLTVVAAGLGLYARQLAEVRRQLRLLDEALGQAVEEHSFQDAVQGEFSDGVMVRLDGQKLTEATFRLLSEATLVEALFIAEPSEPVRATLSAAFDEDPRSGVWFKRK